MSTTLDIAPSTIPHCLAASQDGTITAHGRETIRDTISSSDIQATNNITTRARQALRNNRGKSLHHVANRAPRMIDMCANDEMPKTASVRGSYQEVIWCCACYLTLLWLSSPGSRFKLLELPGHVVTDLHDCSHVTCPGSFNPLSGAWPAWTTTACKGKDPHHSGSSSSGH